MAKHPAGKHPESKHRIAVMPGDGIGKEVVPEGLRVLEAVAREFGVEFEFTEFDWSCDYYAQHGRMMPEDWFERLRGFEAMFYGAVGWPATVPDHVSLWGSLIQFRRGFDQYVNLRPCKLMPGIPSPLANRKPGDIDFVVVRENTEGEYSSVGGRMFEGTEREIVFQESVFTRKGVDRIMKFAFELARTRPAKHLTSATKSNGISITMPYWDERFNAMTGRLSGHPHRPFHIDILSAHFVQRPERFDVVVGVQPLRRHPVRPGARGVRNDRHRALGQPESRARRSRRCSSLCTAPRPTSPAGHRQSDRPDLVGGADARLPRPQGRGERGRRRHRARARRQERAADARPRRPRDAPSISAARSPRRFEASIALPEIRGRAAPKA